MDTFWTIAWCIMVTLFIAAFAYFGVFLHEATTEDIQEEDKEMNEEDKTVTEFYDALPEEKQETITAFVKAAISRKTKISSKYIKCFKTEFTDTEKDITYYLVGSAIEKTWSEVSEE